MNKKEFRGEYLAPNVKVVEVKVQQQILQVSPGNLGETNRYNGFSWDEE